MAKRQARVQPDPDVDVAFRLTAGDHLRVTMHSSRHSWFTALFGALFAAGTVVAVANGQVASAFVPALLGLGFATGVVPGVLAAVIATSRREVLARDVRFQAGPSGTVMTMEGSISQVRWDAFRRVRETSSEFLLDFGTGAATFVPKRVLEPDDVDDMREWIRQAGLLDRASSWVMPLAGVIIGVAVSVLAMVVTSGSTPA